MLRAMLAFRATSTSALSSLVLRRAPGVHRAVGAMIAHRSMGGKHLDSVPPQPQRSSKGSADDADLRSNPGTVKRVLDSASGDTFRGSAFGVPAPVDAMHLSELSSAAMMRIDGAQFDAVMAAVFGDVRRGADSGTSGSCQPLITPKPLFRKKAYYANWVNMPFVNRKEELRAAANALLINMGAASEVMQGAWDSQSLKLLTLTVCGHLFGAGKTTFGPPLAAVMRHILDRPVQYIHTEALDFDPRSRDPFAFALSRLLKTSSCEAAVQALCERVGDKLELDDLLSEVSRILVQRDEFLFLHLDEFIVETMPAELFYRDSTGVERLFDVWCKSLIKIQKCPRILLFVTGKSVHFNVIGGGTYRSPSKVHQVMLTPLPPSELIRAINLLPGVGFNVREELGLANDADLSAFALKLYEMSGGLPRFAQLLLAQALSLRMKAVESQKVPAPAIDLISPGGEAFVFVSRTPAVKAPLDVLLRNLWKSDAYYKAEVLSRFMEAVWWSSPHAPVFDVFVHEMRTGSLTPDSDQVRLLNYLVQFGFYYEEVQDLKAACRDGGLKDDQDSNMDGGLRVLASPLLAEPLSKMLQVCTNGNVARLQLALGIKDGGWRVWERAVAWAVLFDAEFMRLSFKPDSALRRIIGLPQLPNEDCNRQSVAISSKRFHFGLLPCVNRSVNNKNDAEAVVQRWMQSAEHESAWPAVSTQFSPHDFARFVLPAAARTVPEGDFRVFVSAERSSGPDAWLIADGGKTLVGVAVTTTKTSDLIDYMTIEVDKFKRILFEVDKLFCDRAFQSASTSGSVDEGQPQFRPSCCALLIVATHADAQAIVNLQEHANKLNNECKAVAKTDCWDMMTAKGVRLVSVTNADELLGRLPPILSNTFSQLARKKTKARNESIV